MNAACPAACIVCWCITSCVHAHEIFNGHNLRSNVKTNTPLLTRQAIWRPSKLCSVKDGKKIMNVVIYKSILMIIIKILLTLILTGYLHFHISFIYSGIFLQFTLKYQIFQWQFRVQLVAVAVPVSAGLGGGGGGGGGLENYQFGFRSQITNL